MAALRFFFYGTLLEGSCNPVALALHRRFAAGVPASARGALHAVPDADGWYPAFHADPARGPVAGMLYRAPADFGPADLAALDAYENCHGDDPAACEYERREILVSTAAGPQLAQAYCYCAPLPPGAMPILDGDFRAFLARTGLPEYRPAERQTSRGK